MNLFFSLFEGKSKKEFIFILFGMVLLGILEVTTIASIMPFISLITDQGEIERNFFLRLINDYVDFDSTQSFLFFIGLSIFIFLVFTYLFSIFMTWRIINFSSMLGHHIALGLLKKYLYQPYNFFLNSHTSKLNKNILTEVERTVIGAVLPIMMSISRAIISVLIFVLLLFINVQVTILLFLFISSFYFLISRVIKKNLKDIGKKTSDYIDKKYKVVSEGLRGIKEIKLMNLEDHILNNFASPSLNHAKNFTLSRILALSPKYIIELFLFGSLVLFLTFLIKSGNELIELIPQISIFLFAGYKLTPSIQQVYDGYSTARFNWSALENISKDYQGGKASYVQKKTKEKIIFKKEISLKNLSYSYDNSSYKIFNEINIKIKKNSVIGIVGDTGSGKSTLINLLLGLIYPTSGKIMIDNVLLTDKNVNSWNELIGFIPQKPHFIDASIAENIAFNRNNSVINYDRIETVSKIAQIHTFVEKLEGGYKTIVGEEGVKFSGGQSQRIAIARALYNNPQILIMDEPTSALDSKTEKTIIQNILKSIDNKTVIIISHKPDPLNICDSIFKVNSGNISKFR